MDQIKKQGIAARLEHYCKQIGSQNRAGNALRGVSAGTISQVRNDNWEQIADRMWRKIDAQLRKSSTLVETRAYKVMTHVLCDAQDNARVFGVVGSAGCGKTEAIKDYVSKHPNAYHLVCASWGERQFLFELLKCMGEKANGGTASSMAEQAMMVIKSKDAPLLIFDEADKLSDSALYFFITLYNMFEHQAGMVCCATSYFEKRIRRGMDRQRKGYEEIFSRFGGNFIQLPLPNTEDVAAICIANGIMDTDTINDIYDDCNNDLRRVDRKIHAYNQQSNTI